jgi:hypothetical protein
VGGRARRRELRQGRDDVRDRVRQAQEALGAERVRQAVVRQARQFPGPLKPGLGPRR